ncbi:MAG: Tfp pilus assembly protein FimT/FimU [Pseudoxanthomonas sp.]|nr:Tfp pilus assembly protein FimT/FimU [Pseudoxanthomonas sp.]
MRKDAPGPVPGFSLVETSASLAVLAILVGLALPGFRGTLERQRAATAMHLVGTQLAQARNTAITRRIPVTVCPSRGGGRCLGEPDWSAGWLLYLDRGRNDQPQSPDDVLRDVRQPVHESIQLLASAGRLRVRYQPDGRSGGNNLTLRICSSGRLHGEVIVNNVGRVRTHRAAPDTPCG